MTGVLQLRCCSGRSVGGERLKVAGGVLKSLCAQHEAGTSCIA